MSLNSLNFLNGLSRVEHELRILLEYAESPEECTELGPEVLKALREDVAFLIGKFIGYVLISQNMQVSRGDREDSPTVSGLEVVRSLIGESFISVLQRLMLDRSNNLALTRDTFLGLYEKPKVPDSDEFRPSQTERLLNLLNTVDLMEQDYLKQQQEKEAQEVVAEVPDVQE